MSSFIVILIINNIYPSLDAQTGYCATHHLLENYSTDLAGVNTKSILRVIFTPYFPEEKKG
jgi:hypothetical protein